MSARPYGGWELPPLRGPVLCDPFTAHHLRVAWRGAGGAELRTAASGEEAALARDPSPPHAVAAVGTALRDALASETSWETGGDFGEFRLFVRRR
ncbi:MAG: hypothetical protein HMLKMBBP_03900 [Planctomycetes bacterium]|nr:hypothetical protein [Planctomycetota bacterium]